MNIPQNNIVIINQSLKKIIPAINIIIAVWLIVFNDPPQNSSKADLLPFSFFGYSINFDNYFIFFKYIFAFSLLLASILLVRYHKNSNNKH